jgi:hypothetical protein
MRNKYEMLSFETKLCRKAMKRTLALPLCAMWKAFRNLEEPVGATSC